MYPERVFFVLGGLDLFAFLTVVVANLKISDSEGDITNSFELIESLKNESDLLASESEQLRP